MVKKRISPYYYNNYTQLSIGGYSIRANYAEVIDESCVAFEHRHDTDFEIAYCMNGILKMRVDGKCVTLNENDFLIIKPGSYHDFIYEPNEKSMAFLFVFEKPCFDENLQDSNLANSNFITNAMQYIECKPYVYNKDKMCCDKFIKAFMDELEIKLPGYEQMVYNSFTEFMIGIFRNFIFPTASKESSTQVNSDFSCNLNIALECTRYIHDHYHENIKLQDVANYFHVSERHISRTFEGYFGKTIKKTLNTIRISYAKNYLANTDYSIDEISDNIGFTSANVLYRLFKSSEGITPLEYRIRCRQKKNE